MNASMKLEHVVDVFDNSLIELSNEDAVRVCLLYILEKDFNECLPRQHVINEYFSFLWNLDEFNKYHVVNL